MTCHVGRNLSLKAGWITKAGELSDNRVPTSSARRAAHCLAHAVARIN